MPIKTFKESKFVLHASLALNAALLTLLVAFGVHSAYLSDAPSDTMAGAWASHYAGLLDKACGEFKSSECFHRPDLPRQALDAQTADIERARVRLFVDGESASLASHLRMDEGMRK